VNKSIVFVLAGVIAVTLLLSFGGKFLHSKNSSTGFYTDGMSPAEGTMAPDFTLPVLGGADSKTLQLSSLKGKAVLVNLWATWCEPCKVELPWLVELQKKYSDQGFVILGVTSKDESSDETILAFAHKMKMNYPILRGNSKVDDLYPSAGLPLSIFVDRSGKVVRRVVGITTDESVMEDAVKKALGQSSSAKMNTASAK
jgi:thiol-disulfide isomerase/thioredoxin